MVKSKILWANRYFLNDKTSGASLSVRELLSRLRRLGHEIGIVGATVTDAEAGLDRILSFIGHEGSKSGETFVYDDGELKHNLVITRSHKSDLMTLKELNSLYAMYTSAIATMRPDIVFFYGGNSFDYLIPSDAKRVGCKTLAYIANGNYMGQRWGIDVDLAITDTKATAELYRGKVVPPFYAAGKFIDPKKVVSTVHTRQHIVFVNPTLAKGAGIVVQLAMCLQEVDPSIRIKVFENRGNWSECVRVVTAAYGNMCDTLPNVDVVPATNDPREIYETARFVLVPSLWWESGARVIAEAIMNRIPVIVSNSGGNYEMAGEAGIKIEIPEEFRVAPYMKLPDIAQMRSAAQFIVRAFKDKTTYDRYVGATELEAARFDADANAKALSNVLLNLVEGTRDVTGTIGGANAGQVSNYLLAPALKSDRLKGDSSKKKVFVDCGAYDGCSVIKYAMSQPDFEFVSFEPNDLLHPFFEGVPTYLIKAAVATFDGEVEMIFDDIDLDGSTIVPSKRVDFWGKVANKDCRIGTVKCVDLSRFIRALSDSYDYIVLKMDIEGAEYEILEKMLEDGSIGYIKELHIEFHWSKCGYERSRHEILVKNLERRVKVSHWDALDYSIRGLGEAASNIRKDHVRSMSARAAAEASQFVDTTKALS